MRRIQALRALTICTFACPAMLPAFDTPRAIAVHFPVTYPAISFLNARTGWVLAARGSSVTVMQTSDAGRSWARLAHLSLALIAPTMQFVDERHGWISANGPMLCSSLRRPACRTVLLRTGDGGKRWRRLAAPATNGYAITFVDSLHGWLIHSQVPCKNICHQSLYATVDGGTTWRPLPAAPRLVMTTMSWVDRKQGWLGGGGPHPCISSIFATTDGGRSWTRQLALPKHCGWIRIGMLDARHGWALGGADTRYCSMGGCGDYALYRTVDGGKQWTTELAPSRKWWAPGGYAGGFPGPPIFVTPRYGWIPFGTGAGPGAGGIAITTDAGHTWRRFLGAYGLAPSSVAPVNAHDGWLGGLSRLRPSPPYGGDLLHTIDGGRTWSKLHPQP